MTDGPAKAVNRGGVFFDVCIGGEPVIEIMSEGVAIERAGKINRLLAPLVEKAALYDEMMRTKKADLESIMAPLFDKAALADRMAEALSEAINCPHDHYDFPEVSKKAEALIAAYDRLKEGK